MRIRSALSMVLALLPGLLGATSCQGPVGRATDTGRVETQEIINKRTPVLEQAQQKREDRTKELKAMDVPRLAQELATESQQGNEPFNSLTFTEIVSRGETAADVLAPLITKPDRSSLFALLALRKMSPNRYKQLTSELRVDTLVDALKSSRYFNTWGLPHLHWEDAAKALIEEGRATEKALQVLLSDKRDAPVWGGEDFAEYQRYKYRVCDYAWALLNEIRGQKITIPENPVERDRLQKAAGGRG